MNVYGRKGAYSDADTSAAPTAAGYEGSQTSSLHGRSMHPVDLYTIDSRVPSVSSDGASSAQAGNTRSDLAEQPKVTPPIAQLAMTQTMTQTATIQGHESQPTPGQGSGASSAQAGNTILRPGGGAPNDGGEGGGGNGGRKDTNGASSAKAGSTKPGDPDDDDNPDDWEDDEDLADEDNVDVHKRDKTKPKEAGKIELAQFPQGGQWRAWRADTI